MDDLLEPLKTNQDNDDDDEDEGRVVKGGFQAILEKGVTWPELVESITKHQTPIYTVTPSTTTSDTTSDDSCCCIVAGNDDAPDDLPCCVDIIVINKDGKDGDDTTTTTTTTTSLKVASTNVDAAATTLDGILQLLSSSNNDNNENEKLDVTLKCFAMQPRQSLPTLLSSEKLQGTLKTNNNATISWIRFHYFNIDQKTMLGISSCFQRIELRQCTVLNFQDTLLADIGRPSQQLTISCAMPEFNTFGGGFANNTTTQRLDLVLHFWLQGDGFINFCNALASNTGLQYLSIKYLDINDDGWTLLMNKLHKHPSIQSLKLAFTDNFQDNYRRLTPERRTARTQAVLDLVNVNTNLIDVSWPEFQKDQDLMSEINTCLEERRRNNQMNRQ